jgi:hypothetical protein
MEEIWLHAADTVRKRETESNVGCEFRKVR